MRLSREPVTCMFAITSVSSPLRTRTAWQDTAFLPPGEPRDETEPETAGLRAAEAKRVQDDVPGLHHTERRPEQDRVRLSGEGRTQQPVVELGDDPSHLGGRGERPKGRALGDDADGRQPTPVVELAERPDGHLLQAEHVGAVAAREPDHLPQEGLPARRHVFPWKRFQVRTSRRSTVLRMRVVISDPPAFTPAYDHELAASLARQGVDVELVTSRFRFGETPEPDGYRRSELFYPLSSRVFKRSRLRLPLKAAEHVPGTAAPLHRRPDVLHMQWLAAPELDRALFRPRVPAVFTAHDLLPRRTAAKSALWRKLLARFDRVIVHSEHGRRASARSASKQW